MPSVDTGPSPAPCMMIETLLRDVLRQPHGPSARAARTPLALPLAAAADVQPLAFNWAFNGWLVVLAVVVAAGLIVYLYRAQRRIASRRLVGALTAIRLTLVALMFVLLAGPVYQWRHARESGGTVWVLIDQSVSMAQVDRQMTPAERLRWADALALLPPEARPGKLPRHVADLAALRAGWLLLKDRSEHAAGDDADAAARQSTLATDVHAWAEQLHSLAGRIDQERAGAPAGDAARDVLRAAAAGVRAAAERAHARASVRERLENAATAGDVPWGDTLNKLDAGLASLRPIADLADEAFLAQQATDRRVQAALADVAGKSRIELAVAAATSKAGANGTPGLLDVLARPGTRVVAFADSPVALPAVAATALPETLTAALKPTGHSTDLAGALRWVNEQIGPDERATVVVVSDGRHTAGGRNVLGEAVGSSDLIEPARLLASRGVRVFGVAVGSARLAPDAAVERVDAPDWIYKDDTLRAAALLRLDGLAGKPVTVELRRAGGAAPLWSETVTPATDRATKLLTLHDEPAEAGVIDYEVSIKPVADEAVAENNTRRLRVAVKRERLNALVIDDQPRWEYRYLTNYLERDRRVKLQKVLFHPAAVAGVDRPPPVMASPANEGPEAQLLPDAPEKWAAFDMVVLGDVPPERLSAAQQAMLARAVTDRGTALVLIAGRSNMPARYAAGTAVSSDDTTAAARSVHDLLPVELAGPWAAQDLAAHVKDGFRPVVAPDGQASVLSQFTLDAAANGDLWSALPAWYWHSERTRARPAASVVWAIADAAAAPASARGATTAPSSALPGREARQRALLATMPVGLGRVMYLASDSTWRLRQVAGENLHERFWGQVVRWAVGNDLPAGGRLVKFGTDKPRYVAGEPVTVTARLLGKDMAPLTGKTVRVVAREQPASARDANPGSQAEGKRLAETTLIESPDAPGYYRATIGSLPAGRVELTLAGKEVEENLAADPTVVTRALSFEVLPHRDDERNNINADPASLAALAEAGGGFAVAGPQADVVASHLPRLSHTLENVEQIGLFSNPRDRATRVTHWVFLTLFLGLLTAEWVIRKAGGLV